MSALDLLRKVIAERTKGPLRLLQLEQRGMDQAVVTTNLKSNDEQFIAAMGTHADLMMAVIDAADARAEWGHEDFCLRNNDELRCSCSHGQLEEALTALKTALRDSTQEKQALGEK